MKPTRLAPQPEAGRDTAAAFVQAGLVPVDAEWDKHQRVARKV